MCDVPEFREVLPGEPASGEERSYVTLQYDHRTVVSHDVADAATQGRHGGQLILDIPRRLTRGQR